MLRSRFQWNNPELISWEMAAPEMLPGSPGSRWQQALSRKWKKLESSWLNKRALTELREEILRLLFSRTNFMFVYLFYITSHRVVRNIFIYLLIICKTHERRDHAFFLNQVWLELALLKSKEPTFTWNFLQCFHSSALNSKQLKCPSVGRWVNKLRYISTIEY